MLVSLLLAPARSQSRRRPNFKMQSERPLKNSRGQYLASLTSWRKFSVSVRMHKQGQARH